MLNEEIIKRYEHLVSERAGSVESIWDMIERFVVPYRGKYYQTMDDENNVDWHRREVYDSTAVRACKRLSSALHTNLTSPSMKWFELQYRDDKLNEAKTTRAWLEDTEDRITAALNDANFNIEISESYLDLASYGTAVMLEETDEETGALTFTAVPVKESFFEEDFRKQVKTFYRALKLTPVQMIDQWGDEGVPQSVRDLAKKPDGATHRMEVVFCIYPRPVSPDLDLTKDMPVTSMPYGCKYVLKDTKESLGEEMGYYMMPAYITRWSRTADSRWGYSPATEAMADIMTLNHVVEATLEAAGKAIDPANLAEETALLDDLDLDRGALNIVTSIDAIKPYESGTRFDVSNLVISDLRDSINRSYMVDKMSLKDSPQMTAEEVIERRREKAEQLGPPVGRIQTDLLEPLIRRTYFLLDKAKMLSPIPEELKEQQFDVTYSGEMAQMQKMTIAMGTWDMLRKMAEIHEVFPSAADMIDVDAVVREVAELSGIPAKVLNDAGQVKRVRAEKAAEMKQMQDIEMARAEGEAMQAQGLM